MESESKHFSHEHELTLNKENDTGGEEVVCDGCNKPITDDDAYSCSDCNFFLHKTCAELPEEINNVSHPAHPLSLFAEPPYEETLIHCDCCDETWGWFTYNCDLCEFDVCMACVLVGKIKHLGHDHPLIPYNQVKENDTGGEEVVCGGCNKPITDDDAYSCSDCNFFLHKTCAELPEEINHISHPIHALKLYKKPPLEKLPYSDSHIRCDCCHETWRWFTYNCKLCDHNICVPCSFVTKSSALGKIKHSSHDHPLIVEAFDFDDKETYPMKLSTSLTPNTILPSYLNKSGKLVSLFARAVEKLGCGSSTIVGFVNLRYAYHVLCYPLADLQELKKKSCMITLFTSSLHHQILIQTAVVPAAERGQSCYSTGCATSELKSIRYSILERLIEKLSLLMCASVPDTIVHEAHRHPLVPSTSGYQHCSACKEYGRCVTYGCDTCGFYLEAFCAMFPRTATHYYDAHPLSLVYPPFPDHPDDFYCEMCQDEITPTLWLYHCRDCDQSFHPRCLLPGQSSSNIKSGGTCVVAKNIHEHPKLKLQKILQGERISKWRCSRLCDSYSSEMLACTECDWLLCLGCLMKYPSADVQMVS
ncbi:hypothetical protein RJ640_010685 [Escallonia rubra]|uniref:Phorbol-ester/DAG-type domain-containing protein n=1 Tax=Escallonia rubra TaxID=112253 RepID=A0AA88S192_9ASTE|nr:hypothetical protein RJ640_010685 [Escallonia rubra]